MKVSFVLSTVFVACLSVVANSATCPAYGSILVPDTYSCSKYLRCENGVATESECNNGLFFGQEQQTCTTPQQANCATEQFACPRPYIPGELNILAHGDICNYFFICANGMPVVQNCASGLNFNRYTHHCDASECLVSDKRLALEERVQLVTILIRNNSISARRLGLSIGNCSFAGPQRLLPILPLRGRCQV